LVPRQRLPLCRQPTRHDGFGHPLRCLRCTHQIPVADGHCPTAATFLKMTLVAPPSKTRERSSCPWGATYTSLNTPLRHPLKQRSYKRYPHIPATRTPSIHVYTVALTRQHVAHGSLHKCRRYAQPGTWHPDDVAWAPGVRCRVHVSRSLARASALGNKSQIGDIMWDYGRTVPSTMLVYGLRYGSWLISYRITPVVYGRMPLRYGAQP